MKIYLKTPLSFVLGIFISNCVFARADLCEKSYPSSSFQRVAGTLKYVGIEGPTWVINYKDTKTKEEKSLLLLNRDGKVFSPPKNFNDRDDIIIKGCLGKSGEIDIYQGVERYIVTEIKHVKS